MAKKNFNLVFIQHPDEENGVSHYFSRKALRGQIPLIEHQIGLPAPVEVGEYRLDVLELKRLAKIY